MLAKFKILINFTLLRANAGEVPRERFHPSLQLAQWRKSLQVKGTPECPPRARRCTARCSLPACCRPAKLSAERGASRWHSRMWNTGTRGSAACLGVPRGLPWQPLAVGSESGYLEKGLEGLTPPRGKNTRLVRMAERMQRTLTSWIRPVSKAVGPICRVALSRWGLLGLVLPFLDSPFTGCAERRKPPPALLNLRKDSQNPILRLGNSGLSKAKAYN